MLNSREYEWADLSLDIGGNDFVEIRAVKLVEKIEREPVYGKGRFPLAIQSGNAMYEGEVVLLGSGYEKLVRAGNGSVLSLSVDGLLSMGNPPDTIIHKRAVGMRFTEASSEWKQGDKFQEITLPFICVKLQNNV